MKMDKVLGINATKDIKEISLLKANEENLNKWRGIPCHILEDSHSLKMSVLPNLSTVTVILIKIPNILFKEILVQDLTKLILKFI